MNKKQTEKRSLKKKVKKRNTNKRTLKKHNTKRNKRTLKNNKRKSNKKKHFVGGAAAEENADAPTNEAELVKKMNSFLETPRQLLVSEKDIEKMIQDLIQFIKVYQENILDSVSNSESNSGSNNQVEITQLEKQLEDNIYDNIKEMCTRFQDLYDSKQNEVVDLKKNNEDKSKDTIIFYNLRYILKICKHHYDIVKKINDNIKNKKEIDDDLIKSIGLYLYNL